MAQSKTISVSVPASCVPAVAEAFRVQNQTLLNAVSQQYGLNPQEVLTKFLPDDFDVSPDEKLTLEKSQSTPDKQKNTLRKCKVPLNERCMARCWNGGAGGQCTRRKKVGDLCSNHNKIYTNTGTLPHGRVDQQPPKELCHDLPLPSPEKSDNSPLQSSEDEVDPPSPVTLATTQKKKRGRPAKKDKPLQNDKQKPKKVTKPQMTKQLVEIITANENITEQDALQSMMSSLQIPQESLDSSWFTAQFQKQMEKIHPKPIEPPVKLDDVQHDNEVDDEENEEEEEEEIACKQITYKGSPYLLDPSNNKVYSTTGDNDFVGKLTGDDIDFDAADSDDEED